MGQEVYRKLMESLAGFAKVLQQDLSLEKYPEMEMDRTMIFYKVKEISGLLQDMMRVVDARENPEKIVAEFKKKKSDLELA